MCKNDSKLKYFTFLRKKYNIFVPFYTQLSKSIKKYIMPKKGRPRLLSRTTKAADRLRSRRRSDVLPSTSRGSNNNTLQNEMRNQWINLGSKVAFSGISNIYNQYNKQFSKDTIKHTLSYLPAYTKYKEVKKTRVHNPFFIYYKHQQWQLDITYVTHLENWNNGIKYLLIVMECFSRKIFVTPLKTKSTTEVVSSFDDIHTHIGATPNNIYMDKGLEFNSELFKEYCREHGIKPLFANSSTKAALVERSQRTLQGIMYRYMDHYNTKMYIDKLDEIVATFNSKVNRTIKMSPNEAYKDNNATVVLGNLEVHYNKRVSRKKNHVITEEIRCEYYVGIHTL